MKIDDVRELIRKTISDLEESGDIVITTPIENKVSNEIAKSIHKEIPLLVTEIEFSAITNSLNSLLHNIKPDDRDFQTIIGITKEELAVVLDKLQGRIN